MATQFLQKQIYWLFWKKAPGPKDHQRHFAIIYSVVIFAYLAFTVYQWEAGQPANYYQRLNVPLKFETRELKNSFRSLSLQYHPDKAPQGTDSAMFEQKFMEIRKAYDVLKEPAMKGIYGMKFISRIIWACVRVSLHFIKSQSLAQISLAIRCFHAPTAKLKEITCMKYFQALSGSMLVHSWSCSFCPF